MNLALDFDETYTRAPMFWDDVIRRAKEYYLHVFLVTIRSTPEDKLKLEPHFEKLGVPIVYCDGRPKKEVVKERGINIDVWIDDRPEGIWSGTNLTAEQLAHWRMQDVHRADE